MSSRVRQLTATQGFDGRELEIGIFRDDGELIAGPQLLLHVVGGSQAADARAKYDDVCHVLLLLTRRIVCRWL